MKGLNEGERIMGKERCSCGAWMTNFDTSFEWEGVTIPHNLYMCTNPRCPGHIDKNFLPKIRDSASSPQSTPKVKNE
uniref:Uncharacterized protein n=2 Tax=viral metagenome TaxID=1070528 RepID=A0A6M3LYC2_9ZZZZ